MSLAQRPPSAAAAASASRAAHLRACARPTGAPARSLRQPSMKVMTTTAAASAAAATASIFLLRAKPTRRAFPRPVAAAAAAAAASSEEPAPAGGRLAERGDMVTVHYTLYEEVLGSSPAPPASASSSSSSAAGGDGGAAAAAAPATVVEDPAKKKKYQVLDSSREGDGRGEPLTFEVGAGDVFGNELFQAFDEVVRGRAAGETVRLTCPSPPAWDPELLFRVPGDHPEVERMRGRYKNVGGLAEGLVVELSNGKRAVVVAVSEEEVTLDANDMLAGGSGGERVFELELVRVEAGKKKEEGE